MCIKDEGTHEIRTMIYRVVLALTLLAGFLTGCGRRFEAQQFDWPQDMVRARYVFRLPDAVDECSGAVAWTDTSFLTHNDDGPAELFEVSYSGRLVGTLPIPGATNEDWEDLARDSTGTLYMSDLGNNRNRRKDLGIYVYTPKADKARFIPVRYEDQRDFPPRQDERNFDCEALFYRHGALWAVTKNRGLPPVKLYRIGLEPGSQVARIADTASFSLPITGADVSPDGRVLALCAYGKVYLMRLVPGKGMLSTSLARMPFAGSGQAEAVWWRDQKQFYVANEEQEVFCFERSDGKAFQ